MLRQGVGIDGLDVVRTMEGHRLGLLDPQLVRAMCIRTNTCSTLTPMSRIQPT
jgi:hypothetical protein